MNEMEVKILDIDVNIIRKKMTALGAAKVKEENQTNKIFDFPDKKLLNKKGYARIRIVEDLLKKENRTYMTTKKMISQSKYKIMEENETEINDSTEGENIFYSLGLELIHIVKKYRESYKYKSTLVEIDINEKEFFPFPYIEIETNNEDELKEVVSLLGYTMDDITAKSISDILKDLSPTKGL